MPGYVPGDRVKRQGKKRGMEERKGRVGRRGVQ